MDVPSYDDIYELKNGIELLNKKINLLLEQNNKLKKKYKAGNKEFNSHKKAWKYSNKKREEIMGQFAGATGCYSGPDVTTLYGIEDEWHPAELNISIGESIDD